MNEDDSSQRGPPFVDGRRVPMEELDALLRHDDVERKHVATWIATRHWQDPGGGGAPVSAATLADYIGCSPDTVERHRSVLKDAGFMGKQAAGPRRYLWFATTPESQTGKNACLAEADQDHADPDQTGRDACLANSAADGRREKAHERPKHAEMPDAYAYSDLQTRYTNPDIARSLRTPARGKDSGRPGDGEVEFPDLVKFYREKIPLPPAGRSPEPVAEDPDTGAPIVARQDEDGWIMVWLGDPQTTRRSPTQLPPNQVPDDPTRGDWIQFAHMPLAAGHHPETGVPMKRGSGKAGPYVIYGTGDDTDYLDLDVLDRDLRLLTMTTDEAADVVDAYRAHQAEAVMWTVRTGIAGPTLRKPVVRLRDNLTDPERATERWERLRERLEETAGFSHGPPDPVEAWFRSLSQAAKAVRHEGAAEKKDELYRMAELVAVVGAPDTDEGARARQAFVNLFLHRDRVGEWPEALAAIPADRGAIRRIVDCCTAFLDHFPDDHHYHLNEARLDLVQVVEVMKEIPYAEKYVKSLASGDFDHPNAVFHPNTFRKEKEEKRGLYRDFGEPDDGSWEKQMEEYLAENTV